MRAAGTAPDGAIFEMPVSPAERIGRQVIPGHLEGRAPASIACVGSITGAAGPFDRMAIILEILQYLALGQNITQALLPDVADGPGDADAGIDFASG